MRAFALLVLVVLAVSGCAKTYNREIHFYAIDFRPFTREGFLFTPEMYDGDYDAIGVLSITILPGDIITEPTGPEDRKGRLTREGKPVHVEHLSVDGGLMRLYEAAADMGADAVVNLKIRRVRDWRRATLDLDALEVEGLAIRRKGAF